MGRGLLRQLEGIAGHVGEGDDFIALVVMSEDEYPIAERCLRDCGTLDECWIGGQGQVARAVDSLFGFRVGSVPEQQQGQGRGRGLSESHSPSVPPGSRLASSGMA